MKDSWTAEEVAALQESEVRLVTKGKVLVPDEGRFAVYDGKVYRIKDEWIEQAASDREEWGVVIWKKEES